MVAARIEFEPFIDEGARQFIMNGVDAKSKTAA
jgi:hypothetical protein